jgi:prepilin-type N-terminal cleavage/methylation domain-containing protein
MRILKTGNYNNGFTLFELIIVIFLVSLIFALAMPSFSILGESTVKSEAKRLASIVRYLNDSALTIKETFSLSVDLKEKMIGYVGPDGKREQRFESIKGVELMSKGTVSAGELKIFFGPTGTSEAFNFYLEKDGNSLTVAFHPFSGKVRIVQNSE